GANKDVPRAGAGHKQRNQRLLARRRRYRPQQLKALTVHDPNRLQILDNQISLMARIAHLRREIRIGDPTEMPNLARCDNTLCVDILSDQPEWRFSVKPGGDKQGDVVSIPREVVCLNYWGRHQTAERRLVSSRARNEG